MRCRIRRLIALRPPAMPAPPVPSAAEDEALGTAVTSVNNGRVPGDVRPREGQVRRAGGRGFLHASVRARQRTEDVAGGVVVASAQLATATCREPSKPQKRQGQSSPFELQCWALRAGAHIATAGVACAPPYAEPPGQGDCVPCVCQRQIAARGRC